MYNTKKQEFTVSLDAYLYDKLKSEAKEQSRSLDSLISIYILDALTDQKKK